MTTLTDARLQLHWAAQIAAGVGRTLLAPRPDDSQTAFTFVDGALLQEAHAGLRAGLRLHDLTLVLGSETFPLHGRTLDDGFAFLESRFGHALNRPNVDLPDHPVAHGAAFDADLESCETLGGLYAIADPLLREFAVGPVLCWPHHFDIATLLTVREGTTIGVGLSPGDASYPDPYWYVTPWPYPAVASLPPLTRGTWHTTGWVGAVLPATGDARAFIEEAIARCRELLRNHT
ncbi:MAG TPA: hypothetical protein VN605_01825 [Thermoanaerobaculia bacterium]|nr:hypothetical protein [Thermoanaerobaculia bacterium]